jgi:calcineurin-like phosphoesterase family protein
MTDRPTTNSFRAIHVGDLHFSAIPLNPFSYRPKRFLGVANLIIGGRRKKFRTSMGHLLVERLRSLADKPDALLFSGDFSSTSLKTEFRQATTLLGPLVAEVPAGAWVVPGNHDCYTHPELGAATFNRELSPRFRAIDGIHLTTLAPGIALLSINATTNNGLLGCHGALSPEANSKLSKLLNFALGPDIAHLWILCHFPPEEPTPIVPHVRGLQLRGAEGFLQALSQVPARKLWLHGHHHYRWIHTSPTVEGLTYLNAGAPFLRHGKDLPDLGYHELIAEGKDVRILTHYLNQEGTRWLRVEPEIPAPGQFMDLQKNLQPVSF